MKLKRACLSFLAFFLSSRLTLAAPLHHGRQFVGLSDFSQFTLGPGDSAGESTFVSPEIVSQIKWDELVVSWNVDAAQAVVTVVFGPRRWKCIATEAPAMFGMIIGA